MSKGRFASLHAGMLVRAQVANGGFYPVEAPTNANAAITGENAPLYRTTRPNAETGKDWSKMAPARQRKAEVLPPGSVVEQPQPEYQVRDVQELPAVAEPHPAPAEASAPAPVNVPAPVPTPVLTAKAEPKPEPLQDVQWSTAGVLQHSGEETRQQKRRRRSMTLRLEPMQHRTLKLASARLDRSCQDLMTEAVDDYLRNLGFDWHENGGNA